VNTGGAVKTRWIENNNNSIELMKLNNNVLNTPEKLKLKKLLGSMLYNGNPVPKNKQLWNSISNKKGKAQRRADYVIAYARTHQNARFEPWRNRKNVYKKVPNNKLVRKANVFGNIRTNKPTRNKAFEAQKELLRRLNESIGTNRANKLLDLVRASGYRFGNNYNKIVTIKPNDRMYNNGNSGNTRSKIAKIQQIRNKALRKKAVNSLNLPQHLKNNIMKLVRNT
jgi:hypothetical protein